MKCYFLFLYPCDGAKKFVILFKKESKNYRYFENFLKCLTCPNNCDCHCLLTFRKCHIKGTFSRDFRPSVFSSINTPGPPDSWAKAVSNINPYSRRYSILSSSYPKNFLLVLKIICREDTLCINFC
jgi:hypothetical protein